MTPLLAMPLSYPTSPYSTATPDYTRMTGNLPPVQINQTSFADALNNMLYAQSWSSQNLSAQELSQLLWAAYGYSSTGHRTVPSAYNAYPTKIWFLNATATYEFIPETHSVTLKLQGDKRLEIATALGSQNLANASTVFLVIYDSSLGGDGGAVSHEWPEVEAGAIVQNILLEATSWDLSGNIVSQGLGEWNGAGAASIRNILGLSASLVPLYAVPVGHGGVVPEVHSPIIITALLVATSIATAFYSVRSRKTSKVE
ncbi:nitroreductase family protein, partial [Candidatus Bathyarchaeota archaeon]|nr:nitroreductase family protein [Candidatus Bathyarchaeota archaeon]